VQNAEQEIEIAKMKLSNIKQEAKSKAQEEQESELLKLKVQNAEQELKIAKMKLSHIRQEAKSKEQEERIMELEIQGCKRRRIE